MKKLTYLLVLILFSCSTDSVQDSAKSGETSFLKKVTDIHNDNDEDFPKAEYNQNKVETGISEDALVLVNNIDGQDESFYLIRFEDAPAKELNQLKNGTYEIVDLQGELVVSTNNKTFYFTTKQTAEHSELFKADKSYEVYEISKHFVEEDVDKSAEGANYFETLKRRAECKCVSIWSYETCDAGGEGSTYCSGSTCSVACNERYFACCQN